jgi:hypothetical protein
MAPVRPVLHRLSCSKETVRNATKHEFWVQWSGSHALIAKIFEATSFTELVRQRHLFGPFCIDFPAIKKKSKMPQNMSFRSNRVDMVHSLQKIQPRLCLANVCVNGTCSASFAMSFVQ